LGKRGRSPEKGRASAERIGGADRGAAERLRKAEMKHNCWRRKKKRTPKRGNSQERGKRGGKVTPYQIGRIKEEKVRRSKNPKEKREEGIA